MAGLGRHVDEPAAEPDATYATLEKCWSCKKFRRTRRGPPEGRNAWRLSE